MIYRFKGKYMYFEHASLIHENIYLHPRVAYQDLPQLSQEIFINNFPDLVSFRPNNYYKLILIFDWDHLYPSKEFYCRLLGYYNRKSFQRAQGEIIHKNSKIVSASKFPEFDVDDFEDISADEYYLFQVDLNARIKKSFFLSEWKRILNIYEQRKIVEILNKNRIYHQLLKRGKNQYIPVEIVSWIPPCLSKLKNWTVEVQYITELDRVFKWGKTFFVDLDQGKVLFIKDFQQRRKRRRRRKRR